MVCRPKEEGGLGIKNLQLMNDALLCKWVWKLKDPVYFGWWKEIVRVKYENNSNYQRWSPSWRNLKRLEQIVNIQCSYRLGDGKNIRFWEDKWSGECALHIQYPALYKICIDKHCTVAQVVDRGVAHLRFSRQLSERNCVDLNELYFLMNSVSLNNCPDVLVWGASSKGIFSIKELYRWLDHRGVLDHSLAHIWKINIPSKIQIFFWLLCKDRLLTRDNLALRGWEGDVSCVYCPSLETIDHAFFICPQIRPIWAWFFQQFGIFDVPTSVLALFDSLSLIDSNIHKAVKICWCAIFWIIWLIRNDSCFNNQKPCSLRMLGTKIHALVNYWADMWDLVLKKQVMEIMPRIESLPLQLTMEGRNDD